MLIDTVGTFTRALYISVDSVIITGLAENIFLIRK